MTIDLELILRKWDFDLESEALGTIRIANADLEKIFKENETAIRAGDLEGVQLARMLVGKLARKLTGDEVVDKGCTGPLIEGADLDLLSIEELDIFADNLIKSQRRFAVPNGSTPSQLTAAKGYAALSSEFIAFADGARAERAKLYEAVKKSIFPAASLKKHLFAANQIEAQWTQAQAAAATLAKTSFIDAGRASQEAQWQGMLKVESMAHKAAKDWTRQEDQARAAMGNIGDRAFEKSIAQFQQNEKLAASAAQGRVGDGGIAKWVEQHERDQKWAASVLGTKQADLLGFQSISTAERIQMATGGYGTLAQHVSDNSSVTLARSSLPDALAEPESNVAEFRPVPFIHPAPNPAHETNKIAGEMLERQKKMDAKKEQAEAKKEAENVAATATSRSGLRYTKAGVWSTVIVAILGIGTTRWVYLDQKADAAENAKVAAAEIAKQRAENRELVELLRKSIGPRPSSHPAVKPARTK